MANPNINEQLGDPIGKAKHTLDQAKFFADQIKNDGPALKLAEQKIAEVLVAELGNPAEGIPYAFSMVVLQRVMAVLMIDRVEAVHKDRLSGSALERALSEASLLDTYVSTAQRQLPGIVEAESINRMTPEQKALFIGLRDSILGGKR